MSQTTSSGWPNIISQPERRLNYGVLISWMRQPATGVQFFTINTSTIGGSHLIKGGGSAVTFFDKYFYLDYSRYAMNFSVSRKLGQYPYGVIMGQADVQLDNTSKLFLPNFDATIGSGILPNRPMKLSLGFEGELFKLFVGFTGQPENTLGDRLTTLHAFDAFDYINGYVSAYSGALTNAWAQAVVASGLQEMGFSVSQSILDTGLQQPIGYLAPYGRKWGDIFRDLAEAEQALIFADENGLIRFWNRQHFTTTSGAMAFMLNYSKLSDLQWQNTPIINDVIVRAKPRSVQPKQKVWENTGTIQLNPGVDTDVFIDFTDDFGDLPVTSVDIPAYITSATTSFYATNDQSDGSGTARNTSIALITAYSFGSTYKLTFRNSYTSIVYLTQLAIYATPAKVTQVIEQRYSDATSLSVYGRNPSNNGEPVLIENDLLQNNDSAYSLAYTLVKEYKDPRKRYLAPTTVGNNPALQIGDYGCLKIQDTNETKSVWITGITHKLQPGGDYVQELEIEERSIKKYFTIGQSKIAGLDSIAP